MKRRVVIGERIASMPIPESADVVVGVTKSGDTIVGLPLTDGGSKWTFDHALDGRPAVAGNLVIGSLAKGIGVRNTLLISGASCLLVVFFFFRQLPRLRKLAGPVLARLGSNVTEPVVYSEEED